MLHWRYKKDFLKNILSLSHFKNFIYKEKPKEKENEKNKEKTKSLSFIEKN